MPRLMVVILAIGFAFGGLASAPVAAGAQDDTQASAAAQAAAQQIFQLAASGDFNALYDRIHPDAHAVIPRVVAVQSFEEIYKALRPGSAKITGVKIGDWTWAVTGKAYPNAAQVTYSIPFVDVNGQQTTLTSEMYLVPDEQGQWRWFFGRDRAYVAEVMGRFAPPPPAPTAGDTNALLNNVVNDLDTFYRNALAATDHPYTSPQVVAVDEGQAAQTGCGLAQTGFWAFYCPPDQTLYLDLPFLRDLSQRYGDFAAEYVVGHEWAHHIQGQIGIERSEEPHKVLEVYSRQIELMADCFTGVWTQDADTRGLLDLAGIADAVAFIHERLGDPSGVGPFDPQAHGSADDRVDYFTDGYEDGFLGCNVQM